MKIRKVVLGFVMTVLMVALNSNTVLANGTKTQVYIANEIINELKENNGCVNIQGQGLVKVPEDISNAILNQPDAFRAGAVGPDFYPSFLVGLRGIHANESGYFLEELIKNYNENPPSDLTERQKIEAFLLGMQLHYAGDIISRNEFREIIGGEFPRIAINMNKNEANLVLKYTAVEGYYDSILPNNGSYKIAAPIDFVAKHMAFNGGDGRGIHRGLNYKYKYKNTSKDEYKVGVEIPLVLFVRWHNNLGFYESKLSGNPTTKLVGQAVDLKDFKNGVERVTKEWIKSNERAASRVLEGEAAAYALTLEYKDYVNNHAEKLIPFNNVRKYLKATPIGLIDEIFGVSDYITNEVVDFLGEAITSNIEIESGKILSETLLNDPYLFNGNTDALKEKIEAAGNKSLKESINLAKLTILGRNELGNVFSKIGIQDKFGEKTKKELKKKQLEIRIKTATDRNRFKDLGYSTNGDVYARVDYGGFYEDHKLGKPNYNDFENAADDRYVVPLKDGYDYNNITSVSIYLKKHKKQDDWRVDHVWIYVDGKECDYKHLEHWIDEGVFYKVSNGFDVSEKALEIRFKTATDNYVLEDKGYGTNGDVYARVNYGSFYEDHKLGKPNYNDFENAADDRYVIPVKAGYDYSDITSVGFYLKKHKREDDWRLDHVWLYLKGESHEYDYKHIENWIAEKQVYNICGNIVNYEFQIIPEFFRGVYSLDKKSYTNNILSFISNENSRKKIYNDLVVSQGTDSEHSSNIEFDPDKSEFRYNHNNLKTVTNKTVKEYSLINEGSSEVSVNMCDYHYWKEDENHTLNWAFEDTFDVRDFGNSIDAGNMYCGTSNKAVSKDGAIFDNVIWYSNDNGQTYKIIAHSKSSIESEYNTISDVKIPIGTTHIKIWTHAWKAEEEDLDIRITDRTFTMTRVEPYISENKLSKEDLKNAIRLGLVPERMKDSLTEEITVGETYELIVNLFEKLAGFELPLPSETYLPEIKDINARKLSTGNMIVSRNVDEILNREQLAYMIYRPMDVAHGVRQKEMPYVDGSIAAGDSDSISSWAQKPVDFVLEHNIYQIGGEKFHPSVKVRKEEAVLSVLKTYYKFKDLMQK